ncbi:MAG TPA: amino-acid racemase, partial [Syntrophomonas sp.]|nr:amino-acid racemase [Syntrophomonas sp.]
HNVKALREILPAGSELMAVVKANAYGHGDVEIAANLNHIGVSSFAVATIDEGIRLRTHGIKGDILILGYTLPERAV